MNEILNAVTGPIGGFTVEGGGCMFGTVAVAGATSGMTVSVSPQTYPGDGIWATGFVSSAGVVTVKVCSVNSGYIPVSLYNVAVATGTSDSGPILVTSFLNQSGSIPQTTLFTPAVNALYLVSFYWEVLSTNNVGALSLTANWKNPATAVTQSLLANFSVGTGADTRVGNTPILIGAGQPFTVLATATGLTGTVYNVYCLFQVVKLGVV